MSPILKDRLFWGGMIATVLLGIFLTIHGNLGVMPYLGFVFPAYLLVLIGFDTFFLSKSKL